MISISQSRRLRPRGIGAAVSAGLLATSTLALLAAGTRPALADPPIMGWSSWTLQATKLPAYGGTSGMTWATEARIQEQSVTMKRVLGRAGFTYINLDSGWSSGQDKNGRRIADPARFPGGLKRLADFVHARGQKLGLYLVPGVLQKDADDGAVIAGTDIKLQSILFHPARQANSFGGTSQIDYSQPGSQEYIDSVVALYASWGIDFIKLDGVTPGSQGPNTIDCGPEVRAYHLAIKKCGRPIKLVLSWAIAPDATDRFAPYVDAWRTDWDIEPYDKTLTAWPNLASRFKDLVAYQGKSGKGVWNDLDSLDCGCGALDGLTDDERDTMATFWALECSNWYTGDDLTRLDEHGIWLLTHPALIAQDQSGNIAFQKQGGDLQVWANYDAKKKVYLAGLFNLSGATATVTCDFASLGFSGEASLTGVLKNVDLGKATDTYSVSLPSHGSLLLRIKPKNPAPAVADSGKAR